jgi:hypothetical protein
MVLAWLIGFFLLAAGVHAVVWGLENRVFSMLAAGLIGVIGMLLAVAVLIFLPFILGAVLLDQVFPRFPEEDD